MIERRKAAGRIVAAGSVVNERRITVGRIAVASGIAIERLIAAGRVVAAAGVEKKRPIPTSRIEVAGGVVLERGTTVSCVVAAGGVVTQRVIADGRVLGGGIVNERELTVRRVEAAGSVLSERRITGGRIVLPVVFNVSADWPMAVFPSPLVSDSSALEPRNVFSRTPQPCSQVARVSGESAKHVTARAMREKSRTIRIARVREPSFLGDKPRRKGDRLVERLWVRDVVVN